MVLCVRELWAATPALGMNEARSYLAAILARNGV